AIEPLKRLVRSGSQAIGRLHGLWTLQGLNALEASLVEQGLSDAHPGIRENALLLAEPFLPESKKISDLIVALEADESPRVRFQAALTLGLVQQPETRRA